MVMQRGTITAQVLMIFPGYFCHFQTIKPKLGKMMVGEMAYKVVS